MQRTERTGQAALPLHYGKAPKWLFNRMVKLSYAICKIIIDEFSSKEMLRRLSDPFFFQAFGCLLGYDWHSSGLTTTVCGALKEALNKANAGVKVLGGKGKTSRKVPDEIDKFGEEFNFNDKKIEKLKYATRIIAKVDNAMLQDGYELYHHSFIIDEKGNYTVVQQGMNPDIKYARRYHWLSFNVDSFIEEPHEAIYAERKENNVLDLTARESKEVRKISLDIVNDNPTHIMKYLKGQVTLSAFFGKEKFLFMKSKHSITLKDLSKATIKSLQKAYEIQPKNYEELLQIKGVGKASLRALALASELIYGKEASWKDPVKYSFAHGGKDGWPFPVKKKVYDKTIQVLLTAIEKAELGNKERLNMVRKIKDLIN